MATTLLLPDTQASRYGQHMIRVQIAVARSAELSLLMVRSLKKSFLIQRRADPDQRPGAQHVGSAWRL